jgi:hypothetical protein
MWYTTGKWTKKELREALQSIDGEIADLETDLEKIYAGQAQGSVAAVKAAIERKENDYQAIKKILDDPS